MNPPLKNSRFDVLRSMVSIFNIHFKILMLCCCCLLFYSNYAQESLDVAENFWKVENKGTTIYFRIFGEGRPLLILGGGPGDNSDRYLSLSKDLSKSYKCILVDQRGAGKSVPTVLDSTTVSIDLTLSDFEVIRKKLSIDKWSVLGFSYGGYLASLYANSYPNSISSLILLESMGLNMNVFGHFRDNIMSKLRPSDKELIEYWRDSTRVAQDPKHAFTEQIRAMMPGYFYDREKSLIVSQVMKDSDFNYEEVGRWIWRDIFNRKLDLEKMGSVFEKPVLILHGRQDPLGESVAHSISNYYKNSKLTFIEKCGHYAWVEQPDKVFGAINEFMEK